MLGSGSVNEHKQVHGLFGMMQVISILVYSQCCMLHYRDAAVRSRPVQVLLGFEPGPDPKVCSKCGVVSGGASLGLIHQEKTWGRGSVISSGRTAALCRHVQVWREGLG